MNVLKLRICV